MFRLITISCLTFATCILSAQQSNTPFTDIISSGEIPSDFLLSTSSKIESYKNANPEEFRSNKEFLIKSFYGLDEVLQSGRVNFGDPFSNYFSKVADEILKDQPELRNQVRLYALKSPILNAASGPYGFIFINTGTLAYLENEAQLALIICHELAHLKKNHWKVSYFENQNIMKGKGIYGSKSLDERIDMYFRRSHEKELEADSLGIELYLQTGYDPAEIIKTYNIEKYEDLPFGDKPFDVGFFNSEYFKIPRAFFKDSIAIITDTENLKDDYQRHPNLNKRKEIAERIIRKKETPGKAFLVSESEFLKLAELSKLECIRLELLGRNYTRAFYDAYLLMDKYPNNEYLQVSMAKALYGLAKFRNNNEFNVVTSPYSKIRGESQQLYYLFRQLNAQQLNAVALKYTHDLKKDFPDNKFLKQIETELINDLVYFHKVKPDDFNDECFKINFPEENEQRIKNQDEIIALKKKYENFHMSAFCGEMNDTFLIRKFEKAAIIAKKKSEGEGISYKERERKEEMHVQSLRNGGFPVKYQNIIVVDPVYVDLNANAEKSLDNSEKYKVSLDQVVNDYNKINKTSIKLLSARFLHNDIEGYNQLCMMKELRDELLTNYKCNLIPLSITDYANILNSGTVLLCFPVIMGKDDFHYYNITFYDVHNGEIVFKNNDRSVTINSIKELFYKDLQIFTK